MGYYFLTFASVRFLLFKFFLQLAREARNAIVPQFIISRSTCFSFYYMGTIKICRSVHLSEPFRWYQLISEICFSFFLILSLLGPDYDNIRILIATGSSWEYESNNSSQLYFFFQFPPFKQPVHESLFLPIWHIYFSLSSVNYLCNLNMTRFWPHQYRAM